mmetsp:Transcript_16578/g.42962  ORF Transcript_16578/g.42962 Transcript_16578/m.42962 type:complete len:733 (-) Transcript_16578:167-2365(-)
MVSAADVAPSAENARACPKLKLNEMFLQWFNLPDTQHMLHIVLDEAARGSTSATGASLQLLHPSIELRSPPGSPTANGLSSLSLGSSPSTPPRSPELHARGGMRAAMSAAKAASANDYDALSATVKAVTAASLASPHAIPAADERAVAASATQAVTPSASDAEPPVLVDMLPPPISLEPASAAHMELVADAEPDNGAALGSSGSSGASGASPATSPCGPSASARRHAPGALSPQKRPLTSASNDAEDETTPSAAKEARTSTRSIAPFYLPLRRQPADEREREAWLVRGEIQRASDGQASVPVLKAVELMKRSLELPYAAARVLAERLAADAAGGATAESAAAGDARGVPASALEAFHAEWLCGFPLGARLFHALREPGARALDAVALRPLVRAVVKYHPGLAFLETAPEFQERYVETVVLRILYTIARCGPPEVTRAALERSSLPAALRALDADDDINRSTAFFSYEHFYVIYCRFWELDDDHDMQLSQEDLARYDNYSLSSRIIERVYEFAVGARRAEGQGTHASLRAGGSLEPAGSGEPKMTYPQFVWFVLSEEDKNSPTALEYWFRRVDLDGDGYISGFEMEHFYSEQLHRMRCMGQEPVELPDIVCQMFDLVQPPVAARGFSLPDLRKCKLAGRLFDVLFNLNKFVSWEAKDPHTIREERALHHMSEWDRFCKREYVRLALEDDAPDESDVDWGVGVVDGYGAQDMDGTTDGGPGKVLSAGGSCESPF